VRPYSAGGGFCFYLLPETAPDFEWLTNTSMIAVAVFSVLESSWRAASFNRAMACHGDVVGLFTAPDDR
jgi:drug/metabolite transporter superfamily protein YnfA